MLRTKCALLLCLLSASCLAGNRAGVLLPGGSMRFQGLIIAEACRVEAGDRQMTVQMGTVSSNRFHSAGSDADAVPFAVRLQDCSTAVSRRVGVSFRGVADPVNPDLLALGDAPGRAGGVAIAITDDHNNLIPVNRPAPAWHGLQDGPVTLRFTARYRATEEYVSGGPASAHVWFLLTYQ